MILIDSEFLEKLIIKSILIDKSFLLILSDIFEYDYFDNIIARDIFKVCKEHNESYNNIPNNDIIINNITDGKEKVKNFLGEIDNIDFDYANNYQFIFDNANDYLKSQALKKAIISSVDVIEKGKEKALIQKLVEDALTKDLKIDLGLNYFNSLSERFKRILSLSGERVPTYYPLLDELLNGGFPPYTLSLLLAAIHGFKSATMANIAARQVLHNNNVVILTLEMSEDMFAQRFDAIYSNLDINRIYSNKETTRELIKKLKRLKDNENRGNLFIKQFPTGEATRNDFRKYLKELLLRDIKISIVYVDYINLMKPSYKEKGDMYSDIKRISEELRALSFEFNVPVISVSQLNREGGLLHFSDLNFNYVAESIGTIATADFVGILGVDDDALVYENELHYKISKNRLGGRVGTVGKFYYDSRSIRLYDETEMDLWIKDAEESNDKRQVATKEDIMRESKQRGRKKR
jgi:replicative DNA helicase